MTDPLAIPEFLRQYEPKETDMARKKTETDEQAEEKTNGAGPGHNGPPELSEDERAVLAHQWKRKLQDETALKDRHVANIRNMKKKIKAELGEDGVDTVNDMIKLDTEEGEAAVKAGIERQMRAARYMEVPLAGQLEMFPDRVPVDDRAHADGKRHALEGEALERVPHAPGTAQYDSWCAGWHEGKETYDRVMAMQMGPLFDEDDDEPPALDDEPPSEPIGSEEPTYETA